MEQLLPIHHPIPDNSQRRVAHDKARRGCSTHSPGGAQTVPQEARPHRRIVHPLTETAKQALNPATNRACGPTGAHLPPTNTNPRTPKNNASNHLLTRLADTTPTPQTQTHRHARWRMPQPATQSLAHHATKTTPKLFTLHGCLCIMYLILEERRFHICFPRMYLLTPVNKFGGHDQ